MATSDQLLPVRAGMDDAATKWATRKPDYSVVDRKYLAEKVSRHQPGSLELTMENLVKTWEMEANHKPDRAQWVSITPDFFMSINGQKMSPEQMELGAYNVFLYQCPLHDPYKVVGVESLKMFKTAFPGGFAWEVLKCYSPAPTVCFTWRHWTRFAGRYGAVEPTGEDLEMTGMATAHLNTQGRMSSIDIYYDPTPFMMKLLRIKDGAAHGCPFHA